MAMSRIGLRFYSSKLSKETTGTRLGSSTPVVSAACNARTTPSVLGLSPLKIAVGGDARARSSLDCVLGLPRLLLASLHPERLDGNHGVGMSRGGSLEPPVGLTLARTAT
jgi:hypothetical protein